MRRLVLMPVQRASPGYGCLPDLLLAVLAEVRGATTNNDALDWLAAVFAGFAGAAVDAVFQLEEASNAVGIDVVAYG